MIKSGLRRLMWGRGVFASMLLMVCAASLWCVQPGQVQAAGGAARASVQDEHLDIRMRSFAPGASGRLRIDPTAGGGRARLTALRLPRPGNVASTAATYVVWAVSEGRFARLGELKTDSNGNGGLEFTRPAEFETYSVIVTAETSTAIDRPAGSPVLSTRAGEARAMFSSDREADADRQRAATGGGSNRRTSKGMTLEKSPWPRSSRAGDFYSEVEDALDASGGGRLLELFGTDVTPGAQGAARVAVRTGTAFARARFRALPAPSTLGANVYVMWGVQPDGRIIYMGSLPTDLNLDAQEIYLRTNGFTADEYSLYITAEKQRPVHRPSNVRVLETRYLVK